MEPINGISLERYADLGAAITDLQDSPEEIRRVLAEEGVALADFEAAKVGWTARMQDMSLMGRIAMAYMPLYQQALAQRKGGAATLSYADYIHVSAAIKVFGFEGALNACGVSMSEWTEAAGDWNTKVGQNPGQYAGRNGHIEQEEAPMRAGAPVRRVALSRESHTIPVGASGQGAQQPPRMSAGTGLDVAMAQAMNNPHMQQHMQQQAAIQANPLGFAVGQVGALFGGGIRAGSNVMVKWSDGSWYPGQVMQAGQGQHLVQFQGGSQQWVPEQHIKKA